QLGAMYFFGKGSLPNTQFEDVDFSCVEVPSDLTAYRQELIPPTTVKAETSITVHRSSLEYLPKHGEDYGFCGTILPTYEKHFGQFYVGGEIRIYTGLK